MSPGPWWPQARDSVPRQRAWQQHHLSTAAIRIPPQPGPLYPPPPGSFVDRLRRRSAKSRQVVFSP